MVSRQKLLSVGTESDQSELFVVPQKHRIRATRALRQCESASLERYRQLRLPRAHVEGKRCFRQPDPGVDQELGSLHTDEGCGFRNGNRTEERRGGKGWGS